MTDRYDITLVPTGGGFALADAGVRHFLRGLLTRGLIAGDGEHHGQTEVRIFMTPGPWAHTIFMEGAAPSEPVFVEAELRFGAPAVPPGSDAEAHFWLCFRGALRPATHARFRKTVDEQLRCRVRGGSVPHGPLPDRPEPLPQPAAGPSTTPAVSPVGTRVEEL